MSDTQEISGIRSTIETYFRGHATGDTQHFRECFLPTAHIEGFRGEQWLSWNLDQYCAVFPGTPAADEASRARTIDAIDVTGAAAMAKATLVHGAVTFTDYFVLVQQHGNWKIANKVFNG
ncbi:MAG: nuclear transport factor 2 family protein [Casimicrobium sp.]